MDAEIIPPLMPRQGEELIIKNRWNAFFGTDLDELLKSKGISNLIIVGAATDVCVLEMLRFGRSQVVNVADVYKMFE